MLFPLWVSSITTPTTTTTMLNTKFLVRSDGFPFCVSILFSSVQSLSCVRLFALWLLQINQHQTGGSKQQKYILSQ